MNRFGPWCSSVLSAMLSLSSCEFDSSSGPCRSDWHLTPNTIDFDTVTVGNSRESMYLIENNGTCHVHSPKDLCPSFSNDWPRTAYPERLTWVGVVFEPTSVGTHFCVVDLPSCRWSVNLVGVGDDSPPCGFSPASIDFGTVAIGDSVDTMFTITNIGKGTLSSKVTIACPESLGTDYLNLPYSLIVNGRRIPWRSFGFGLQENESGDVEVRFRPTSVGTLFCTVETDHPLCGTVDLIGISVEP